MKIKKTRRELPKHDSADISTWELQEKQQKVHCQFGFSDRISIALLRRRVDLDTGLLLVQFKYILRVN